MGATWALARAELRARARSLVGLALIVALAAAVVLAAVVGARRSDTTVDRFRASTRGIDATIQSDGPESARAIMRAVRSQPYVRAATLRYLVNGFPQGVSESLPDFAVFTDPAGRYGAGMDRLRIVRGRVPDPRRPDEIVVDEPTARLLHRDVGDRIDVATWSERDLEALFGDQGFPGFNGPALRLRIVGVARTLAGLQGDVARTSLQAFAGPGFLDAHPGIGAWPPVVAVRVDDPARNLPRLAAAVGAALGSDRPADLLRVDVEYLDAVRRSVGAVSTGLWVFAAAAGLAALVTVGQAASRQIAAAESAAAVARSLGMTRRRRALTVAVPTLLATTLGVVVGAAAAVALSPLFPLGIARQAEVSPGVWVDLATLLVAAIAALLLVVGWVSVAAWRSQSPYGTAGTARRSSIAARVASWGTRPSVSTGVRAAFEARERPPVPVRSALAASMVAVIGIVGAGVVAVSLRTLESQPARWGWNWSSEPDAFGEGARVPLADLVAERRVAAVANQASGSVLIGGTPMDGFSLRVLKGSLFYTLAAGRIPVGPAEVALDQEAMRRLGASVGDRVSARKPRGRDTVRLTIVGSVVVPADAGSNQNGAAVLAPEGLRALNGSETESSVLVRYAAGVDGPALERDLARRLGLSFGPFTHALVPGRVRNLDQARGVTIALAAFFALLGLVGLSHALVVSTRRRARDFAVLRAMGFRRGQVRTAVSVQAIATVAAGLAVGIPVGLVAGRAVWNGMVGDLRVVGDSTIPWILLLGLVPIACAVAAIVAWYPGRRAATVTAGPLLRGDE